MRKVVIGFCLGGFACALLLAFRRPFLEADWMPITARVFVARAASILHLGEEFERRSGLDAYDLWRRDPAIEARAAILAHDRGLIGVAGFGVFYPAVPRSAYPGGIPRDSPPSGFKRREVMGAGDYTDNGSTSLYQEMAYNFALQFNRRLLSHYDAPRE